MGIGHCADLDDELIEFKDNLVTDYLQFSYDNLFNCQYLNLRGSSFDHLQPSKMYSVIYADISFTKIKKANFKLCKNLIKMIRDKS